MSKKKIEEYLEALTSTEMKERGRRALPTTHVLEWADYPFRYAAPAFQEFIKNGTRAAAQEARDTYAQILGVYAAILARDYAKADAFMETYGAGPAPEPLRAMRFTRRFTMPPIDLPAVQGAWPTEPSLFVSCDPGYLKAYAVPLLRSVAQAAPSANVHLHIMGMADVPAIDGIRITSTHEAVPADFPAREYFGAVRLARFAQALESAGAPLIMVDADALVTADFRPLFSGRHAAMRVRAGRIEPWTQYSACCLRGTADSLNYYKAVADIVLRTMHAPFWGMDQYALLAGHVQEHTPIDLFGPDVASVTDETPGVFWFTAGNAKLSLSTGQSPYAQLFRRYSKDSLG